MAWPAVSQASAYPVCAYVGPPQEKLTALGSPALAFPVCSSDGAPSLAAMTKPSAMALTAHEAYSFLACAFRPPCYSGCAFSQVPFFVRPASSCAAMPFFFASLLVWLGLTHTRHVVAFVLCNCAFANRKRQDQYGGQDQVLVL